MIRIKTIVLCLCIGCLTANCKKNDGNIEYPVMGSHGPNLLFAADSTSISLFEVYSLAANMNKNSEPLEIHLINPDESIDTLQWKYEPNTINGWNIYPFDTLIHFQKLRSYELNHIDVGIKFIESGPFRIEVYENNQSTPVRTIIIEGHETFAR